MQLSYHSRLLAGSLPYFDLSGGAGEAQSVRPLSQHHLHPDGCFWYQINELVEALAVVRGMGELGRPRPSGRLDPISRV
jgi:hypothetical protein